MSPPHRRVPRWFAYGVVASVSGLLLGLLGAVLPHPAWHVLVITLALGAVGVAMGHYEERLEESSFTDPLTGLANRRYFRRRFVEEADRASRHRVPLALLVVDVDHLKDLNDREGHKVGDLALQTVARCLEQSCRKHDLVSRHGGDEFVILLPNTNAEQARELGDRIRASVRDAARRRSRQLEGLSVSIGACDLERAASLRLETLFETADRALYQAKTAGRDQVILARPRRPRAVSETIFLRPDVNRSRRR